MPGHALLERKLELNVNADWAKLPLFDRKGWKRLPFGAFAESVNARVEPSDAADEIYVGLDDLDPQNLHIRRWGKGSDVIGTKLRFRKGDIIFGRRRAYQRKLAVAEFDGICSAHAMVVRAKPELVLPEFLPFLMMSDRFMTRAVEISVGSLSPTINWKALRLEEFDLPPLAQQECVSKILWAAESSAQSYVQLKRSHRDYLSSLSNVIFSDASNSLAQSNWSVVPLQEFAVTKGIVNGPFGSDLLTSELQSEGTPVIYVRDVKPRRYLRVSTVCVSQEKAKELQFCDVKFGDVLVAKVGEPPCDAAPYLDSEDSVVTQDVIRIRPKSDTDFHFLAELLNSSFGRAAIKRITIGGGRMRVSLTEFKALHFPKPPVEEQRRLSAVLESGEKVQLLLEAYISQLKKLQDSLIENLVTG